MGFFRILAHCWWQYLNGKILIEDHRPIHMYVELEDEEGHVLRGTIYGCACGNMYAKK